MSVALPPARPASAVHWFRQLLAGLSAALPRRMLRRSMPAALLPLLLASCYVPNDFMLEIRLGNTGDFSIQYQGELIWAPLLRQIARNEVKAEELPAKNAEIEADLQRDRVGFNKNTQGFRSISRSGNGRFRVDYYREGHMNQTGMATFVRRNSPIVTIKADENGELSVAGTPVKASEANALQDLGLDLHGEVRIVTGARVIRHNATEIKPFGPYRVYIWKMKGVYATAPHLVIQRDK